MKRSVNIKKWLPFIGLSIIYIVSSLSINYSRYLHLDVVIMQGLGSDYNILIPLCDMISRGINPYSVWMHRFDDQAIIPYFYSHYAGSTVFHGIVLGITGASPEVVVAVISPMLANIFILLAVWVVCRVMNFNPTQSFFFFLFFCFLNDQMLVGAVFADAEHIGTALGLVGLGCYLKKKYLPAIPCIAVSCWLHLANLGYFVVLVIWFLLFGVYVLVKNKFRVCGLRNKMNFRNVYVRQALSLLVMGIMIGAYLFPVFQRKTCYWREEHWYEENWDEEFEPDPSSPPDPLQRIMPSVFSLISSSAETTRFGGWILPQRLTDWALVFVYPLTYIYSSFFPRSTLDRVLRLFGYNLTSTDLEYIRSFSLNTPIFVMAVPIIYGLGFPLLFVNILWECIKSQDTEKKLLYFAAYLLIIFFAMGYSVFGIATYGQRFVKYTGCFWVFALVPSGFINPDSRIKKIGLHFFSLFLIARFIIYLMASMY